MLNSLKLYPQYYIFKAKNGEIPIFCKKNRPERSNEKSPKNPKNIIFKKLIQIFCFCFVRIIQTFSKIIINLFKRKTFVKKLGKCFVIAITFHYANHFDFAGFWLHRQVPLAFLIFFFNHNMTFKNKTGLNFSKKIQIELPQLTNQRSVEGRDSFYQNKSNLKEPCVYQQQHVGHY